jgi:hypothetical protein
MQPSTVDAYRATCHCGAVGYVYRTAVPPAEWTVRRCQCAFCRAHGALSTSDPKGALAFQEHLEGELRRYRFAQRTADFLLCGRCGVYVGAEIATPRGRYGIINVRLLDEEHPAATPVSYDGEGAADRIARREGGWTPLGAQAATM